MPQTPEVEKFLKSISEDPAPPEADNNTGGAVVGGGDVGGAPEGQPKSGTGGAVEPVEEAKAEEIKAKEPSGKDGEVTEDDSQKDCGTQ